MKDFDEFQVSSMLERLPEWKPPSNLKEKIFASSINDRKLIVSKKNNWLWTAASFLLFFSGYFISEYNATDRIKQIEIENSEMRYLLLQNMKEDFSVSNRLAVVGFMEVNSSGRENVDDLLALLEIESNENVKLALIQLLAQYIHLQSVQNTLGAYLKSERNPLIVIPIINLLVQEKSKKGRKVLEQMLQQDSIHPIIIKHLNESI